MNAASSRLGIICWFMKEEAIDKASSSNITPDVLPLSLHNEQHAITLKKI